MVFVAALCIQYEVDYISNMSVVVKVITPLLDTYIFKLQLTQLLQFLLFSNIEKNYSDIVKLYG